MHLNLCGNLKEEYKVYLPNHEEVLEKVELKRNYDVEFHKILMIKLINILITIVVIYEAATGLHSITFYALLLINKTITR